MLQPSTAEDPFTALTRASSFHGYPGGDTQPNESQLYRDFEASKNITPKKSILHYYKSPGGDATYSTVAQDDTLRTCVEGDTGYVDLGGYEPTSPTALSTSSHVDELLENTETQQDVFARPALPETPAVAGKKRNSDGEVVGSSSTSKKTPGFSQLFGAHQKGQMMTATQMFNQTQAPSSPPPGEPRSDPIFTRPSPNMQHQASLSSPTFPMSSPVATTSRPGTAGEPRANYTSMRESQERRAKKLREELGLAGQFSEDIIEEEDEEQEDTELMRIAQKRRQKAVSNQAIHEWSRVKAPSRSNSRPTSRQNSSPQQPTTIDLITPFPNKHKPVEIEGFNDDEFFEDDVAMEDGPHDENADNSDDEWDELGQTVLRSQPNNDEDDAEAAEENEAIDEDPQMDNDHGSRQGSSDPDNAKADDGSHNQSRSGTQHVAIADSQPSRIENGQENGRNNVAKQSMGPSSITSFVPGSQYASRTSQDRHRERIVAETSSSKPQSGLNREVQDDDIPSSPPIEAAKLPREISNVSEHPEISQRAVPESDLPDTVDVNGFSSPNVLSDDNQRDTNAALYSTARTHVSESGASPAKTKYAASPLKVFESQQSKFSFSQSPRTAAGVRHFSAIAAMGSPPTGSGETDVDVDAIVSDVVTAEDQNFMDVVSTPPGQRQSKKRKIMHSNTATTKSDQSDIQKSTTGEEHQPEQEVDAPVAIATKDVASTALQETTTKANQLPSSTPINDDPDSSTPDSVKKREQAGAEAASQLLSTRQTKAPKGVKQYGKGSKRAAAGPRKLTTALARNAKPAKASHVSKRRDGPEVITETEEAPVNSEVHVDSEIPADGLADAVDNVETTSNDLQEPNTHNPPASAPNRVFALFKGQFNNFYPATYMGSSPGGQTYKVKFDDGSIISIETQHVRKLELRVGDTIKVDLPEMRTKTWKIEGFGSAAGNDKQTDLATDAEGHTTAIVKPNSTRKSDANITEDAVKVAIVSIYLTRTMWPHFADRTFDMAPTPKVASRAGTPSSTGQTPHAETSNSRSGRTTIPTDKVKGTRGSHLREESVSRPASPALHGLFAGMAFCISYGSNEGEKAQVTRLIRRNGGIIFENGFDELFDLPNLEESMPTSPAKKSPRKGVEQSKSTDGLQLKPEYKDLGFVALIADGHSRRAKYFQALALGLPTLSGRWISDSLDASKNTDSANSIPSPLPWPKYLLPAGESTYLNGAIRSRTIPLYGASEAKLINIIDNREILLNGDGVLIVASKKGKTWERKKTYAFLTLALGAAYVKRVYDLNEAKTIATNEPDTWKWVYVDGSIADAAAIMFQKSNAGKKRKRGEEDGKIDEKATCASDGKIKVVNDEFVVQSLILGALVD